MEDGLGLGSRMNTCSKFQKRYGRTILHNPNPKSELIENGVFGVYSILGKYSIKMNSSRNEVRSSFQCLDIIYDDMFQVLITSLNQSL